jgi:hypothetical protein
MNKQDKNSQKEVDDLDSIIQFKRGSESKRVSLGELKTEMAKVLQIENLSFLIGAGCSSCVDIAPDGKEVELGIPVMAPLFDNFVATYPNFTIAEHAIQEFLGADKNLERIMEILVAASVLSINGINLVDTQIDNKIKTVKAFISEKIHSGRNSRAVLDIYKTFYQRISHRKRISPISIFTTNYDLYNETALDELGFLYNTGFVGTYRRKFSPKSFNFTYVDSMNLQRNVWENVPTFFNIVKLHGSISWTKKEEEIWETSPDSSGSEDESSRVMIYPTPIKDRSTLMTPYSDLFRVMENRLLQKHSTLVVLGYGFGDEHINRIILNGLSIPTFNLVVFGKGENITKLENLRDDRIVIVNSENRIHYFKNFTENVLPLPHPDIQENLSQSPISGIQASFDHSTSPEHNR